MVYQLLDKSGLCEYYDLNSAPGNNLRRKVRDDKFAFLDDPALRRQLITFEEAGQTHISFYLPQIHCSSCLYLLENLHQLDAGIVRSQVNFPTKEISIVADTNSISVRQIAELLTQVGYEPYISLNDLKKNRPRLNRSMVIRLGVAGFCFSNIMLMSFPEYLGLSASENYLSSVFRALNLLLSLPVFFYSASPFYTSGWKGLQHKFLNIDAPIALAIIVTFTRSVYEVLTGSGSGYFDSMTGIVFFMLTGRIVQDKTYQQLTFDRDFASYFPIAVTALRNKEKVPTPLPDIRSGDTLLIHHDELVPADGILTRGKAIIDYSFVTGESAPVEKEMGEILYAGGKQTGAAIEILVIKEVAQSYLTRLWSGEQDVKKQNEEERSFIHFFSRYFTWIVLSLAVITSVYWAYTDPSKVWNAVTAVLIVACPCALLLSNTFTNGNILRIMGRNRFYLRSAQVIEDMSVIDHIVFDKTGTLTSTEQGQFNYEGIPLNEWQQKSVFLLASQSSHPLSRTLSGHLAVQGKLPILQGFYEKEGKGIEGLVDGTWIQLGTRSFVSGEKENRHKGSEVWIGIEGKVLGHFTLLSSYREKMDLLIGALSKEYPLSVISGDNNADRNRLENLMGRNTTLLFEQSPEQKLAYIRSLQDKGKKVMMIGDGLNDAGALRQSNVGIAVSERSNNFTPASDAILDAAQLHVLPRFFTLSKSNRQIIISAFVMSIVYNIIGLTFAVQGLLSPLLAAILMPASSLSILLITYGSSNLLAKFLRL
jgi:Cu+-exporting ATPase